MIRDLSFEELERSVQRKRLTRLVVVCFVVSSAVTFGVARELKIKKDLQALPTATLGDLDSLRARHDGISSMLDQHHFWTGAFQARTELDDLVESIAKEERTLAQLEDQRTAEVARIREEAEVARPRGLVLAERKEYGAALQQLRRARELGDSISDEAWAGGEW